MWEYSDESKSGFLTPPQFVTALRLLAAAQAAGGRLDPQLAGAVAAGGGPALPSPRLAGLEPLPAGALPGGDGGGGGGMSAAGAAPASPAMALMDPLAGAPPVLASTSVAAAPSPAPAGWAFPGAPGLQATALTSGAWPPVSPAEVERYRRMFAQLDQDQDGLVQGADCFGLFSSSGLGKHQLKQIWDIVAGNVGQVNFQQFFTCLYLIQATVSGKPVPTALPPPPFPPLQGAAPPPAGGALMSAAPSLGGVMGGAVGVRPPPRPTCSRAGRCPTSCSR